MEDFAVDASLILADVHRQRSVPGGEGLPPKKVGHAVRAYLEVLDDAAFGDATQVTRKRINLTDPTSRWTAIASVRQAEVTAQRRMIDRTQERSGIWPERLVAGTAYGSAAKLAWLVKDKSIEPHISVFDKFACRDGLRVETRSRRTALRTNILFKPGILPLASVACENRCQAIYRLASSHLEMQKVSPSI